MKNIEILGRTYNVQVDTLLDDLSGVLKNVTKDSIKTSELPINFEDNIEKDVHLLVYYLNMSEVYNIQLLILPKNLDSFEVLEHFIRLSKVKSYRNELKLIFPKIKELSANKEFMSTRIGKYFLICLKLSNLGFIDYTCVLIKQLFFQLKLKEA